LFLISSVRALKDGYRPDEITEMTWLDIEQSEILMPMPFYKEGLS